VAQEVYARKLLPLLRPGVRLQHTKRKKKRRACAEKETRVPLGARSLYAGRPKRKVSTPQTEAPARETYLPTRVPYPQKGTGARSRPRPKPESCSRPYRKRGSHSENICARKPTVRNLHRRQSERKTATRINRQRQA